MNQTGNALEKSNKNKSQTKKNENPKNLKSTYQEPEQGYSRQPKDAHQKHDLFIGLVVDQVLG